MNILIGWLINAIAVIAGSYFIPGVSVEDFITALVVAVVLGVINAFIKPILTILTLPLTIITLGLFLFILNGLMILLTANLVPGFAVDGLFPALWLSIWLTLVSWIVGSLK
jgi:putative membrane protein